jgi:DhnA family fructose-bisphosphate aldolase class Ia
MSRVREILSWYGSDNPGTLTNLARMLNHGRLAGSGKMVILPVDQGFEHGPARSFAPNPPAYDPHYHYKLAIKSGCNAYAAPLVFLEAGARDFAGEVPLILKVNDHDVLHDEEDPTAGDDEVFSEVRAIRDGGGFGSIIGRNSFQRSEPDALKFLDTIMHLYAGTQA